MKNILIISCVIIAIALIFYLGLNWQQIVIALGGAAGPLGFLTMFSKSGSHKISEKYSREREIEKEYQNRLNESIQQKEEQIKLLDKKIQQNKKRLEELNTMESNVSQEVENMSTEELRDALYNYLHS